MNKRTQVILLLVAGALSAMSCKSQYEALLAGNDADAKYKAAFEYFNKGKYTRSAQLFESMAQLSSGTTRDDTVHYYWGLSNYRLKDYYTAEANFSRFLESFPRSPFADDARFMRIDCLYRATHRYELDQIPTQNAIAAIGEYMAEFPNGIHREACEHMLKVLGDRMDLKAYESAKLYYKMEDYKASRVAFRNILKDDAENIYREDIIYYIAMSSYKYALNSVQNKQKDRYLTFVDDYLNFIGEYPESPYRKELDLMYRRSQKALGRFTGSEEELQGKEKEFEKERNMLLRQQNKKNETSDGKRK